MRRMLSRFFPAILVPLVVAAQDHRTPEITATELLHHVMYLASDELEGRRAGTRGAEEAATYIAREFASYGLRPVGDNGTYFQEFEFIAGVRLGRKNALAFTFNRRSTSLKVDQDFRPLGFSSSESFEGGAVFAGYGISAPDRGYDDYAGLDVKGKAVIVLRNTPPDSARELALYGSVRYKAAKAKDLGAGALLLVTGPQDADTDDLLKLSYDNSAGKAGLPVLHITRKAADKLLRAEELTIADLQKLINETRSPRSFPLRGATISLNVDVVDIRARTANVAGLIEGSDPQLREEVIILGAHYDHLGRGGEGSGSLMPDTVAIHNGADDNASGTAGLLELAQAFAARAPELKRSILFLAFAAEELGLLGSAHYVKHPLIPLERTVAMLNMDMIGRLNNRTLIVYGVGTSPGFEELARKHNADSIFVLKLNKDGFGPSDHASFYGKQIPVFHFFTDIHPDYHRPSDEHDKINYEGLEQIARYVKRITLELNGADERPQYVAVEVPRPMGVGRSTRVYMGTIPDFGEQVEGMKLSGVREGSPAAKAGLKAGDVIVKFGTVEVKNLYDFTFALGEHKPGDEVELVVKRGEETITVVVILERRN